MPGLSTISAIILAGGFGTRLQPVVSDRPKSLAGINGRPFLAFLLDQLVTAQIGHVIFCIGYKGELVEKEFGNNYKNITLTYSKESNPLGTAGALALASEHLKSDIALVLNGDSFFHTNLNNYYQNHIEINAKASLLLKELNDLRRFGSVVLDKNNQIVRFEEKKQSIEKGLINSGIYLISKQLLEQIPKNKAISLEKEIFPSWIGKGVYGFIGSGDFIDIGTPKSYERATSFFKNRKL